LSTEPVRRTNRRSRGARKNPKGIAQALAEWSAALGIDQTLRRYAVITGWEEIVGAQIARVTRPQRFENGVLFVSVTTAPWRAELSLQRMEIIAKLNKAAGSRIVKDIRFR
jgi:predicted nucleic acid-binding Zn ribbon protein